MLKIGSKSNIIFCNTTVLMTTKVFKLKFISIYINLLVLCFNDVTSLLL